MANVADEILLIAVLVVVNGYFAAAEIALISARRAALQTKADEGSKGAKIAIELTANPSRLLATIQIGITLVGFLASATAAVSLAKPLEGWLAAQGVGWLAGVAPVLSVFLVTLLISYVTLVFGELAPKRLGLQRAEGVAVAVAGVVATVAKVTSPLVWLLARSTDIAARLLGVKGAGGRAGVSEEEIKLLVTEQGTLLEEEKRMIHEIFELGDTVAREIMVPRVDMTLAEDTLSVRQVLNIMQEAGFSRVPVYHEDRDRVIGIALLRELIGPLADGRGDDSITSYLREPAFVPETKGILPLLSEMRTTRNHAAVVVDEYGGTAGLVTVEDILEEVVGEIADEFDPDRRFVNTISSAEWIVDGRLSIEDAMEMGFPVEESDEYETVAGWLLSELGHIPQSGERLRRNGHEFVVQAMRRRRIARLRVRAGISEEVENLGR